MALWIIEAGTRSDRGRRARSCRQGTRRCGPWPRRTTAQLSDDELTALLDVMHRTMRAAPGVGLAAPQLGLPVAIAVLEDPGTISEEHARGARARAAAVPRPGEPAVRRRSATSGSSFYEGCLSVVGYQAVVARARHVHLTGHDEHGVARRRGRDAAGPRGSSSTRPTTSAGPCTSTGPSCARWRPPTSFGARWAAEPTTGGRGPRARVPARLRAARRGSRGPTPG